DVFQGERERNRELLAAEKLCADLAERAGGGDRNGQNLDGVIERIVAKFRGRRDQVLAADERPLVVDAARAVVRKKRADETERKIAASDFPGLLVRNAGVAV